MSSHIMRGDAGFVVIRCCFPCLQVQTTRVIDPALKFGLRAFDAEFDHGVIEVHRLLRLRAWPELRKQLLARRKIDQLFEPLQTRRILHRPK